MLAAELTKTLTAEEIEAAHALVSMASPTPAESTESILGSVTAAATPVETLDSSNVKFDSQVTISSLC